MHLCQLTISSHHFWVGATANPLKSDDWNGQLTKVHSYINDCLRNPYFKLTSIQELEQVVTPEEKTFSCLHCIKSFHIKATMKIHSGEKKFICKDCKQSFLKNEWAATTLMKNLLLVKIARKVSQQNLI